MYNIYLFGGHFNVFQVFRLGGSLDVKAEICPRIQIHNPKIHILLQHIFFAKYLDHH